MPSCPSLWATMIWAGHSPICVWWAHRTPLAPGTGTKMMENSSCTTATHVQLVNSHFQSKNVQSIPSSVTGCSRATWTPWSIRGEVSRKKDSIRPCAWTEEGLPWKYCSAAPPLSSCRAGPLSWAPAHCWHSPMACGIPCPVPHPAHAMQWSCSHSNLFPARAAAHREERASLSSVGVGPLAEGLFLTQREHEHFLKCKPAF